VTTGSLLSQALLALRHEEFETGTVLLRQAVAAHPDDADAWAYLTGALLALGQADEARDASERALQLDPDGFAPRLKAAELALRLGDVAGAERLALGAVRVAVPGSTAERAARSLLIEARQQLRRGIDRRAELPKWQLPRRSIGRLPFGRVVSRLRSLARA
jgi:cytochrome c-type biogenesis protein CcmH/NrfG